MTYLKTGWPTYAAQPTPSWARWLLILAIASLALQVVEMLTTPCVRVTPIRDAILARGTPQRAAPSSPAKIEAETRAIREQMNNFGGGR